MKRKIVKSLVVVLLLLVVGFVFNMLEYGTTQEYAKIAAQQVNDDSAYYALKTVSPLISFYKLVYFGLLVCAIVYGYYIWRPKKD